MDKTRFWDLIENARIEAQSPYDVAELLVKRLAGMDVSQIMRWQHIFDAYQRLSYKNKLWAAAYVMNGGCSDDGFDYFRGWLMAQGKKVFLRALADPDSLAELEVEESESSYEEMLGVGYSAYFQKMSTPVVLHRKRWPLNLFAFFKEVDRPEAPQRDYAEFRAEYEKYALSDAEKQELASEIQYAPDIDLNWEEDKLGAVVPVLHAKYW